MRNCNRNYGDHELFLEDHPPGPRPGAGVSEDRSVPSATPWLCLLAEAGDPDSFFDAQTEQIPAKWGFVLHTPNYCQDLLTDSAPTTGRRLEPQNLLEVASRERGMQWPPSWAIPPGTDSRERGSTPAGGSAELGAPLRPEGPAGRPRDGHKCVLAATSREHGLRTQGFAWKSLPAASQELFVREESWRRPEVWGRRARAARPQRSGLKDAGVQGAVAGGPGPRRSSGCYLDVLSLIKRYLERDCPLSSLSSLSL